MDFQVLDTRKRLRNCVSSWNTRDSQLSDATALNQEELVKNHFTKAIHPSIASKLFALIMMVIVAVDLVGILAWKIASKCIEIIDLNLPAESMVTTTGSAPEAGVKVNSISPSSAPLTISLTPGRAR